MTTTEERMRQYVKRIVKIQTERRVYVVRTQEVSKSLSCLFKEEGGMMYLAMRRPLPGKAAGLNWLTETRRRVSNCCSREKLSEVATLYIVRVLGEAGKF